MKRTIAAIATAVLFGAVLWYGRHDPSSGPDAPEADTPEACIQRMFEAAARGDVDQYVDCFTGAERQRLKRELDDSRRDAFARSLMDAVASLRGRAVFANGPVEENSAQASYTVDRVYETRTERQTYQLVRQSGTWRIRSVRATDSFQPETPYGTPVFGDPAP